jgi:hypothetical protein
VLASVETFMNDDDSYRDEVTTKVEEGWRIEAEKPDRVTLVRREFGSPGAHLVIAVLTLWWTMGIGNILYGAYKYFSDSQRTIVWKKPAEAMDESGEVIASE